MSKGDTVFLSYSRHDADVASKIAGVLVRNGFKLFDPSKDILAGQKFIDAVRGGIQRSKSMILIVTSPEQMMSGWSAFEVGMFDALDKPVVVMASHNFALSDLPIEVRDKTVRTFDPSLPEAGARAVASALLAAA